MAELNTGNDNGKGRKRSLRIVKLDMTPMVDLAFLLLTFFMLTTTFCMPKIMELTMPAKGEQSPVSNAITVLMKGDKVYWYEGSFKGENTKLAATDHSKELRKMFIDKSNGRKITVIIKPGSTTKYECVIDVLDELKIANINRYAIVDPAAQEIALLDKK